MCGIVGFTGKEQAAPILLEGLSKLEYRGYDSAGIAVRDGDRDVDIVKAKGRLKILAEKTNDGKAVIGSCGIGHTRWATHGEPSENNAHPHRSDDGNIVAVHNGIIENYQELKEKLVRKGYTFYSDTDTEVAVKLIDYYYTKYEGTPVDGRMIEIYLYSSVGAIPFATMSNREWGQIGNNYLRGLFALAFQGFFMMVCVGIYAVLVANIQMSDKNGYASMKHMRKE